MAARGVFITFEGGDGVDIMAKKIPIGLVLSYKLGLSKLLAALDPKYYRTVPSNTRVKLEL